MKTIEQLAQEAKQARENLIATIELGAPASLLADDMILAAVAMVTYQFALGMQEVIDCVPGDSNSCDGWIEWKGGNCPVSYSEIVSVKCRDGSFCKEWNAGDLRWEYASENAMLNPSYDIIAYRVLK